MIKALLFDFDGTLVDTETPSFRAWRETYEAHGVELALERWADAIGTLEGFDPMAHLEDLLGAPVERGPVRERKRAREAELTAAEELRAGVAEYLDEAGRLGLSLAIVSSSSRGWIDAGLARLHCAEGWACIVSADRDVERAKPRPTLYLEALDALGVGPEEAIAFEDSPNGVVAARAAGIFCVAVPNAVTSQLDLSAADVVLDSLADLPLPRLLELVEDRAA